MINGFEPSDKPPFRVDDGPRPDMVTRTAHRNGVLKSMVGGALIHMGISGGVNEPLDWLLQKDPINPANFVLDALVGTALVVAGIVQVRNGMRSVN